MKAIWNYYVVRFENEYGDKSYLADATLGDVSENPDNVHSFSLKSTAKKALKIWGPRIYAASAKVVLRRGRRNAPCPHVTSEDFDPPKFGVTAELPTDRREVKP